MNSKSWHGGLGIALLSVCLFCNSSAGQFTPGDTTTYTTNGRGWKALGICKVVYLVGLQQGVVVGIAISGGGDPAIERSGMFASGLTNGEAISEIDRFYEEGTNATIPVYEAFRWVVMKSKGVSPAKLQEELARLREKYH